MLVKELLSTKRNKYIALFTVITLLLASVCAVSYALIDRTPDLKLKKQDIIIEYGETYDIQIENLISKKGLDQEDIKYLKDNVKVTSDLKNEDQKDYPGIGEYTITFNYKDEKKTKIVKVQDTVAPVFNDVSEVTFEQETQFDFHSVITASDLSPVEITYNTEGLDINTPNTYIIKAIAKDSSGNQSEKDMTVIVTEKPAVEEVVPQETTRSQSNNSTTRASSTPSQSFVAGMSISSQTTQAITVVGNGGSYATLTLHTKVNGLWQETLSCSARVGRNGITSSKREGDGRTPSGIYSLGQAFGVAGNPGTSRNWLQVNSNHYWVDDSNSPYYNQLVDASQTGIQWNSAEQLANYGTAYRYAIAINYNTACTPGAGSAIFLHCSTGGSTAGCVSISQSNMIRVLQSLQGDALIGIYPSSSQLY